jgi:hypothetical protein
LESVLSESSQGFESPILRHQNQALTGESADTRATTAARSSPTGGRDLAGWRQVLRNFMVDVEEPGGRSTYQQEAIPGNQ